MHYIWIKQKAVNLACLHLPWATHSQEGSLAQPEEEKEKDELTSAPGFLCCPMTSEIHGSWVISE